MLNGIKGKLNDDIMIVTGVTGGEIVSWFYPLLICSDFRYIIISIESLDGFAYLNSRIWFVPFPEKMPLFLLERRGSQRRCSVCLCSYERDGGICPAGSDYVSADDGSPGDGKDL